MRDRTLVGVLLAIGLVARIGIALATGNSFQFPDEAVYADTAHRVIAGEGFGVAYVRVPAYPIFLVALVGRLPASVLLLRVAQAAVTALGAGLLYAFASRAIGRGPALGAVFFYAVDPVLVVAAGLLYPEAIAAVLMIAVALAALLAARESRLGLTALAGLLLGLLTQLRPVALTLLPVLAIWISVTIRAPRWRRLLHVGVLVLVYLLSLFPWTYRNYRIYGRLMPVATAGTHSALVANSEVMRHGLTASIIKQAWTDPSKFAARLGSEFLRFWEVYPTRLATDNPKRRTAMRAKEPRLSAVPMFGKGLRDALSATSFVCEMTLALLGVVLAWRTHRRETLLMVTMIVAYALGYALFVAKLRYRIPALPLLFVFAGVGAHATWAAIGARARGGPKAVSA